MTPEIINTKGNPVPKNHCIVPDHHLQTFTIKIRSINGISPDTLKNLVQSKYEVTEIAYNACTIVAK